MPKEKCPHCKQKKPHFNEVQVGVAGNLLNVRVCDNCKTDLEKIMSFASSFPGASGVSAQKPKDYKKPSLAPKIKKVTALEKEKFEKYALSEEEIKQTQALRPTVRMQDTPAKRQKDDVDKIISGQRVTLYAMASGLKSGVTRNRKLIEKAQAELRTMNVKCVRDNGFEAVFEAA